MAILYLIENKNLQQIQKMPMSNACNVGQNIGKSRRSRCFKPEMHRFLGWKKFQVVNFVRKINTLTTAKPTQKFVWQGRDPSGTFSAVK